jgi:hypothetical protein
MLKEINDDEFSREEWDKLSNKDESRWKEYLAQNA